jgi:amidase
MALNVADLATTLSIIAGPDGVDPDCFPFALGSPTEVGLSGLRVAIVDEESVRAADSTRRAVQRAVSLLEHLGANVVDGALPPHLDEAFDITTRYWRRHALSGADSDRQLFDWDRFNGRMTRAASEFDLVIGPVVANVAPTRRPVAGEDYVFTVAWSLTGWPAISLPAGVDPQTGMPLAVQLAAPRWHDHVVLAAALALEAPLSE